MTLLTGHTARVWQTDQKLTFDDANKNKHGTIHHHLPIRFFDKRLNFIFKFHVCKFENEVSQFHSFFLVSKFRMDIGGIGQCFVIDV